MVDNPPRNGITMKNTQQPGQCTDLKKKKKKITHALFWLFCTEKDKSRDSIVAENSAAFHVVKTLRE